MAERTSQDDIPDSIALDQMEEVEPPQEDGVLLDLQDGFDWLKRISQGLIKFQFS